MNDQSARAAAHQPPQGDAVRRVVLLGASNLTKGIGTVVESAYRFWGRPLEVLTALGHGRSYGRASRVMGRQLPGILECGLWPALGRFPGPPTAALVTDIGNDLLYGEPVEQIVDWLEQCLDRLAAVEARTVVTLLPLDNLHTISRARFTLMRTLLFPYSRLTLEVIRERARALDEHLRRMAVERGCGLVSQRAAWYGFDPIHIRPFQRRWAWPEILASWSAQPTVCEAVRGTLARTLYLRSRVPHRRWVFGFEQRGQQPCGRLRDGTTVAVY